MQVLIIGKERDLNKAIRETLGFKFDSEAIEVRDVEAAFELDNGEKKFDLIICDYQGKSTVLLSTLVASNPDAFVIISVPKGQELKLEANNLVGVVAHENAVEEISQVLTDLISNGLFKDASVSDSEFISIRPEMLIEESAILADVFIKLSDNKFVKLLKLGDRFTPDDLVRYKEQKKVEAFYVRKDQTQALLEKKGEALDKIAIDPNLTNEQATRATLNALDSLRELVKQVGFTPAVQEIATNSVKVTLKMLGQNPSLQAILTRLKQGQGKYLTTHSLSLGEISCGIASALGWNSPATFFKLTLASFLHDLPIADDVLASHSTLKQLEEDGSYSAADIEIFQEHPLKAAEYAKKFSAIPPDVDQILIQHHEQPDGSGFPRGITATYISPLAAVLIVAHDMIHHFLKHGKQASVPEFLKLNEERYSRSTFRKIQKVLTPDSD